jgi:hypothetical protein
MAAAIEASHCSPFRTFDSIIIIISVLRLDYSMTEDQSQLTNAAGKQQTRSVKDAWDWSSVDFLSLSCLLLRRRGKKRCAQMHKAKAAPMPPVLTQQSVLRPSGLTSKVSFNEKELVLRTSSLLSCLL